MCQTTFHMCGQLMPKFRIIIEVDAIGKDDVKRNWGMYKTLRVQHIRGKNKPKKPTYKIVPGGMIYL
jgi:hypothetical protein